MKTVSLALIAALSVAAPAAAQSYIATGGVQIQSSGGVFSVRNGRGQGARGMWCGAAEYASRVLGASGTQRLYVTNPRTSGRSSVGFSLSPRGTSPKSVSILGRSVREAGSNLSVAHAIQFCNDFVTRNNRS